MDAILFTIALLTLFTAGFGAVLLIVPRDRSLTVIEMSSLAIVLGAAFVSLASFWLGLFLSGLILRSTLTALCIVMGATGIARKRSAPSILSGGPSGAGAFLLMGILAVQTGLILWLALLLTFGWDGLLIWEFKARLACLHGGVIPIDYFRDLSRYWTKPRYPLFLPLSEAWIYNWLGRCDEGLAKLIFPLLYLAALGFLYIGGSRFGGTWWRGFLPAVLLFFVPLAVVGEGSVSSGYADFPLAVLYLASVIYLLEYWETGDKGALRILGITAAALPWIKQEGIILWLTLGFLTTVKTAQRRSIRLVLPMALPGILVFSGWRVYLALVKVKVGRGFLPFDLTTLWSNLGRSTAIAQAAVIEMMDWKHWSILWPAALLSLILLLVSNHRKDFVVLLLAVTLPITMYSGIFIFSAWAPFMDHLNSSMPRLFLQVSLVALLIVGLAIPNGRHCPEETPST